MGSLKDEMFENDERKADNKLASILGITVSELGQLHYEIEDNVGNDDFLYGYTVQFDVDNCPASILSKVKGLNDGSWVSLSLDWAD